MKRKSFQVIGGSYLLFLAAVLVFEMFSPGLLRPEKRMLRQGENAPSFILPDLQDKMISLSDLVRHGTTEKEGKRKCRAVILSFWATYCEPCRQEIPELEKVAAAFGKKGLKIFLVSIDKEGKEIAVPYIVKYNITLPVLLDRFGRTSDQYGVDRIPALFLLDAKGCVLYQSVGFQSENMKELRERLVKILK